MLIARRKLLKVGALAAPALILPKLIMPPAKGLLLSGAPSQFPNASNTGVPSGTSLTPSGQVELSSPGDNGRTIQALDIGTTDANEALGIAAQNITIKNCKIHATGTGANSPGWVVGINSSAVNVTIQDCEIYGSAGNTQAGPVFNITGGTNITLLRCNIHDMVHLIDLGGTSGTILVQDCYLHSLTSAAADPHYDCVYYGGGYTAAFNFQHNTFEQRNTQTSGVFNENFFGGISNFTYNNNFFDTKDLTNSGTLQGYELRGDAPSGQPVTNMTFTNNAMRQPGGTGAYFLVVSATIGTFSGNYDYDTLAPITSY